MSTHQKKTQNKTKVIEIIIRVYQSTLSNNMLKEEGGTGALTIKLFQVNRLHYLNAICDFGQ